MPDWVYALDNVYVCVCRRAQLDMKHIVRDNRKTNLNCLFSYSFILSCSLFISCIGLYRRICVLCLCLVVYRSLFRFVYFVYLTVYTYRKPIVQNINSVNASCGSIYRKISINLYFDN